MSYYFINYSAEGTKGVFAQVIGLMFPLSATRHDKCFILPVIMSTVQHRDHFLPKAEREFAEEQLLHRLAFSDTSCVQCADRDTLSCTALRTSFCENILWQCYICKHFVISKDCFTLVLKLSSRNCLGFFFTLLPNEFTCTKNRHWARKQNSVSRR